MDLSTVSPGQIQGKEGRFYGKGEGKCPGPGLLRKADDHQRTQESGIWSPDPISMHEMRNDYDSEGEGMNEVYGYSLEKARVVVFGMSKTAFARWIWKNGVDGDHPGFRWIYDRIGATGNDREIEAARNSPGKAVLLPERWS